jgi:hypothetical protein
VVKHHRRLSPANTPQAEKKQGERKREATDGLYLGRSSGEVKLGAALVGFERGRNGDTRRGGNGALARRGHGVSTVQSQRLSGRYSGTSGQEELSWARSTNEMVERGREHRGAIWDGRVGGCRRMHGVGASTMARTRGGGAVTGQWAKLTSGPTAY